MNLRVLIGVLGHELRTPLAAILGYQELLTDGIYGELDAKQLEPLDRIHSSALQLLHLIDGLQELAASTTGDDNEVLVTSTTELLQCVAAILQPLAHNRGVQLEILPATPADLASFSQERFLRAADLAAGAAIKNSSGRNLRVSCYLKEDAVVLEIAGTALDPATDTPPSTLLDANDPSERPLSAAQLRLAMASATLALVQGSIELRPGDDGVTIFLQVPVGPVPD
jgi:signal transduction histidine kinase